ncbi:MAG: hypothetical protein ACRD1T_14120, partial [Acidimicrobiia bacterium]
IKALGDRVPDLVDYPQGCPFTDRCPSVMERCLSDPPVMRPIAAVDGRSVSCHLWDRDEVNHVVGTG